MPKPADIIYSIFNTFFDDTFTAVEFLAILIHRPAEQTGIDGGGNFGGTARFCTVTDNTGGNHGKGY